jgi:deazaflavin-dependent oxidoreductase (nitroreductase family)
MNERNRAVIDEFRANGGKVGEPYADGTLVLLTTTGRKSGRQVTTPLMSLPDGDRVVVFASKGGAPSHPDWYGNLVANPRVTVEVGTEKYEAEAKVITGSERDALYARQVERRPVFGEYEQRTTRKIPVVALERVR